MELSLVLATCNNAEYLKGFLERLSICAQPEKWEVIIVDNGSVDHTAELLQDFRDTLPIKYLYEGNKGKSRALNLGVRYATGAVILFTDDDVLPERNWMISHIHAMRDYPQASIVGGKIVVDKSILPAWLDRSWNLKGILVSEHDKGDKYRLYEPGLYPFGPNMSVRRRSLQRHVNPWPENIGPGTMYPIADETVFCRTISAMDSGDILYAPDCIVEHRARIGRQFFLKSIRRCFMSGCIIAMLSLPPSVQANNSVSWKSFIIRRMTAARSIREFICEVSRIAGYGWGKISGKTIPLMLLYALIIPT